jgi:LAGLIDADG endonuclease
VRQVGSDNVTSGDNQQETARPRLELDPHWVVGFVDGEGCFSVSIHRNPYVRRTRGWQVHPVFHVYQHVSHRAVLEELIRFFSCGRIRPKGPASSVATYAVDSLRDAATRIIPFFEDHPLVVKGADFRAFAEIVRSMRRKEHLHPVGFERLVRLAYGMNAQGKQRSRSLDEVLAGSSETVRQAHQQLSAVDVKIQSDLHGDMQS